MSRSELARKYYELHRCSAAELRNRFSLSISSAKTIIQKANEVRKVEFRKSLPAWQTIEDEIAGLDHTYNPEKSIQHININY